MEEIKQELLKNSEKEFISVEFRNGHFHTVKAYGMWNMWVGSETENLENQMDYINYIENNEKTDVFDILFSDDEEEAKELGIIDENGGWF